jgi:hypothetical protein
MGIFHRCARLAARLKIGFFRDDPAEQLPICHPATLEFGGIRELPLVSAF